MLRHESQGGGWENGGGTVHGGSYQIIDVYIVKSSLPPSAQSHLDRATVRRRSADRLDEAAHMRVMIPVVPRNRGLRPELLYELQLRSARRSSARAAAGVGVVKACAAESSDPCARASDQSARLLSSRRLKTARTWASRPPTHPLCRTAHRRSIGYTATAVVISSVCETRRSPGP